MVYSVFDEDSASYTYYRSATGPKFGQRAPRRLRSDGRSGIDILSALPTLPNDAVKIGTGVEARGLVAGFGDVETSSIDTPRPSGAANIPVTGASTSSLLVTAVIVGLVVPYLLEKLVVTVVK